MFPPVSHPLWVLCLTPSPALWHAPLHIMSVTCHLVRFCVCVWLFSAEGESEAKRKENEQGGRVYAFSPSLLIINVSQVCKIASRSLCSILPSSSLPLAFLSLLHSVFFLHLPRGVGYLTLSISIFLKTQCSLWCCCVPQGKMKC